MANWYVYLCQCSDNSLYTGITTDVVRRIEQHNKGTGAKYTRSRSPVKLVKVFTRHTKSEALKLEAHIKSLSKKEKLAYCKENC